MWYVRRNNYKVEFRYILKDETLPKIWTPCHQNSSMCWYSMTSINKNNIGAATGDKKLGKTLSESSCWRSCQICLNRKISEHCKCFVLGGQCFQCIRRTIDKMLPKASAMVVALAMATFPNQFFLKCCKTIASLLLCQRFLQQRQGF